MRDVGGWLFGFALYGTVLMPVVLPVVVWQAPPGRHGRRLLTFAWAWAAACAVAGGARLASNDGYYSPNHVTYWAHSTTRERWGVVLLLLATLAAAGAVLAFRRAHAPRGLTPALVLTSGALLFTAAAGWLDGAQRPVILAVLAAAVALGAGLSVRARTTAATLVALVGGAFLTTLVMLTEELALGIH
jgi:hypothetical protein